MAGYGYRGRYSSVDDEPERGGVLKVIFSRFWFLIIPLIGLVYANARQVTPQVEALKKEIAAEQKEKEKQRTQTLTSANPIRFRISAIEALSDTFNVRYTKIDSLTENIATFLEADRKATAQLHFESDSLRQVFESSSALAAAYSDSLRNLTPIIDSLETLIADRNQETQRLWVETTQSFDLTDRILNPGSYKKKSALVTGEGEYPNRDELGKRE
ncbi:MAG: hypothetical protein KBD56_02965 [Candidatus Eisenbacteria bacterium]|nr:hypothetical protein [Candidatus Eisenbacteria bacterium]